MAKPAKHVFVCTQTRPPGHPRGSCGASAAWPCYRNSCSTSSKKQLWGKIAVTGCGCLGTCSGGPSVLVYPEGVMYGGVDKDGVAAIVEETPAGRPAGGKTESACGDLGLTATVERWPPNSG